MRVTLLADKIFFCHEKDQRYSLVSIDNKCPVIYLKSLMAREVATGISLNVFVARDFKMVQISNMTIAYNSLII